MKGQHFHQQKRIELKTEQCERSLRFKGEAPTMVKGLGSPKGKVYRDVPFLSSPKSKLCCGSSLATGHFSDSVSIS